MGLPFKRANVYKFWHRLGKTRRLKYVMVDTGRYAKREAERFLKKKGVQVAGKLKFCRIIIIVSDEKKVEPKLVTRRWIEYGPV